MCEWLFMANLGTGLRFLWKGRGYRLDRIMRPFPSVVSWQREKEAKFSSKYATLGAKIPILGKFTGKMKFLAFIISTVRSL